MEQAVDANGRLWRTVWRTVWLTEKQARRPGKPAKTRARQAGTDAFHRFVLLLFQEQIKGPENAPIARFDGLCRYQTNSKKAACGAAARACLRAHWPAAWRAAQHKGAPSTNTFSSPGAMGVHCSLQVSGVVATTATRSLGVVCRAKSTHRSSSASCALENGCWRTT